MLISRLVLNPLMCVNTVHSNSKSLFARPIYFSNKHIRLLTIGAVHLLPCPLKEPSLLTYTHILCLAFRQIIQKIVVASKLEGVSI